MGQASRLSGLFEEHKRGRLCNDTMQDIHIEREYKFIPPTRGSFVINCILKTNFFAWHMRKSEGVVNGEVRNADRLRASLDAGHSIMLTPNHCRTADPIAMGWLMKEAKCLAYGMASWHLFNQGWFNRWALRALGAFSVNREGIDRQAINVAVDILESGERPLLIFPEGSTTRTNDRLHALLDGVAFIARTAAKKRAKRNASKVVIHPVAVKYFFEGDLRKAVDPVLTDIEHRLTWQPQNDLPLMERIKKLGMALLSLKELEYFGGPQVGSLHERLKKLIDRILQPLEIHWLGQPQQGGVVPRVKAIRMKIMPDMIRGELSQTERDLRWRHLADIYLAQQVSCYPPDYLDERPSGDRMLETVERFDEDLFDQARIHGHLKAVIDVGEAIEVDPKRDKSAKVDPLMAQLETQLQGMLDELALESPLYEEQAG